MPKQLRLPETMHARLVVDQPCVWAEELDASGQCQYVDCVRRQCRGLSICLGLFGSKKESYVIHSRVKPTAIIARIQTSSTNAATTAPVGISAFSL